MSGASTATSGMGAFPLKRNQEIIGYHQGQILQFSGMGGMFSWKNNSRDNWLMPGASTATSGMGRGSFKKYEQPVITKSQANTATSKRHSNLRMGAGAWPRQHAWRGQKHAVSMRGDHLLRNILKQLDKQFPNHAMPGQLFDNQHRQSYTIWLIAHLRLCTSSGQSYTGPTQIPKTHKRVFWASFSIHLTQPLLSQCGAA